MAVLYEKNIGQEDIITEWKQDVMLFTQSLYECLKRKYKREKALFYIAAKMYRRMRQPKKDCDANKLRVITPQRQKNLEFLRP